MPQLSWGYSPLSPRPIYGGGEIEESSGTGLAPAKLRIIPTRQFSSLPAFCESCVKDSKHNTPHLT